MIKATKRGYFIISENEDGVTVEKIIDPAELTSVAVGNIDENILELDTFEVYNPEISDTKFVVTVDNNGDEDDGIIVSPLAVDTAEPDYDQENGRHQVHEIIQKALGQYTDIPEEGEGGEKPEEVTESDETAVQSQIQESYISEAEDDNFDFRNPEENTEETPAEGETSDDTNPEGGTGEEDSTEDQPETVEPDETALEEVEVIENEDGSYALRGDVKSLLAIFVGGDNVTEVMKDLGEEKPEDPTVKIESLTLKIRSKNKDKKLNKLLGS